MHTFDWEDDRPHRELDDVKCPGDDQMIYVHHNGDYSGDAILNVPRDLYYALARSVVTSTNPVTHKERVEFKLPAKLLADFSRQATVREVIDVVENMA
jgi:hypothetical protein